MRILNLFFLILLMMLHACTSSKEAKDGKVLVKENGEARLGKSALYLTLPQDMEMYQVHGKEGYYGYNIFPKGTNTDTKAEMVIWSGRTILYPYEDRKEKIDSSYSTILDKKILWRIYRKAGSFYATARNENAFFIWTKERKEIDNLIAVFATLKKK